MGEGSDHCSLESHSSSLLTHHAPTAVLPWWPPLVFWGSRKRTISPVFLYFCWFSLQEGKKGFYMYFFNPAWAAEPCYPAKSRPQQSGATRVSVSSLTHHLLSTPYLHSWMELRANTPSEGPEPGRQPLLLAGEILLQQRGYLHEYRLPLWHRACKGKSCGRPLCTSCSHSQLPSHLRTCCCHHQKLFSLQAFYVTLFLPNSFCSLGMRSTFFSSLFLFLFFFFY